MSDEKKIIIIPRVFAFAHILNHSMTNNSEHYDKFNESNELRLEFFQLSVEVAIENVGAWNRQKMKALLSKQKIAFVLKFYLLYTIV